MGHCRRIRYRALGVTYPWGEELDENSLSVGQLVVVLWCERRDIIGAGCSSKSKKSECESHGTSLVMAVKQSDEQSFGEMKTVLRCL